MLGSKRGNFNKSLIFSKPLLEMLLWVLGKRGVAKN